MGLICKAAGHSWKNGCCRRCGEAHAEHLWEQIPGKCASRCSVCGKTKETDHKLEPMKGKCMKKCVICDKEANFEHTWEQIGCVSKCSVCSAEKESHSWLKHQCSVCGIYDKAVRDLFNASYVNTTSDDEITKLLNSLSQETLTELAIRAKSPYACHAAKDRVLAPALLARIADESDNEFIVRELKEKFMCPHCGRAIDASSLAKYKCQSCGGDVHDFLDVEEPEVDAHDFSCGTWYKKCKRCGIETEHKVFSHYSDE